MSQQNKMTYTSYFLHVFFLSYVQDKNSQLRQTLFDRVFLIWRILSLGSTIMNGIILFWFWFYTEQYRNNLSLIDIFVLLICHIFNGSYLK